MAISLIAKPQSITPAYNEVKYIYDSTNNGEEGFRYIYDIYPSGVGTKIAEYRLLPNLDGYGEIDLSRLLQGYVSYDFFKTNTTFYDATNCSYTYTVKVGEEYIETVSYTSSLTQNGTYVKITATHAFAVGDQVTITQTDGGVANPNLEGLFTVTEINTTTAFTVNSLWSEVTDATIDGAVAYADKRKTVTRDVVTVAGVFAINGAIPFAGMPAYDELDYILTANTDLPLTTSPLEFKNTLTQDMWIHFIAPTELAGYIYFENSTGDIFRKPTTPTGLIFGSSVGANNFGSPTLVSGSGALIEDDVDYYDYWYADSSGTQHSIKHRIILDRRCKINDYEIAFMDRLGSIGSFAFQLREKLTGSVKKEVYNQHIEGSVTSTEWSYDTEAQGKKVINPRIEETYELQTNWMTEEENDYFSELISSPITYLKTGVDPVSSSSLYYACIIQDTGYEKERNRNRNLIRKSIKVMLAVQDRVNG